MDEAPDEALWTAGFFNERFPLPVSPLGWSMLGPLIEELALRDPLRYLGYPGADTISIIRLWHGHPYANVRVFQILYKVFPGFLLPEDAYRYFPDGDTRLRLRALYPRALFDPRMIASMLRAFASDAGTFSPFHNYRTWARYTREHDRRVQDLRARLDSLRDAEPGPIFEALREAAQIHCALLRIHRWSLTHADLTFGLLSKTSRAWLGPERGSEFMAREVTGIPNKTMEVDADLGDLAQRIERLPAARDALARATQLEEFTQACDVELESAWRALLARHGHRSFSLDIAVPTFADDPMQVLQLVKAAIGGPRGERPVHSAQQGAIYPRHFWERWALGALRDLAVEYVALREDQRYYWQKSLAISRQLYLLLADRWVAEGVLPRRDDIFYATHEEVVRFDRGQLSKAELSDCIAARKAEWDTYARETREAPHSAYPAFLRGDNPLLPKQGTRRRWQARPVSPGTARGRACVVQAASDLVRVQGGEILIAPSTDPAWTPVFAKIAGLVLERGGVLSHGAVVAREYGLPAVAGIADICEEISSGEMIWVDGNTGSVSREDPNESVDR